MLFKQLTDFTERQGYRFVNQLDLAALTAFRTTWKDGPLSASKKVERIRGILKFALRPFTDDEMKKILKAAVNPRVNAFIQVMRYSGLRISDTATLAVDALKSNRLQLSQTKTGEPVSVLLPNDVAQALRALPCANPKYFFWNGSSRVTSVTGFWRARLRCLHESENRKRAQSSL
jgi:integrase